LRRLEEEGDEEEKEKEEEEEVFHMQIQMVAGSGGDGLIGCSALTHQQCKDQFWQWLLS
jgi:hypothetical protein